ncbi:Uncharacterized membrane protein [Fontimonas thermophila]|uniref:Uncharacterized membrane protein n=1 Tax=Fontimonas thermophila TaxID=1076937 RepID=A0A1I2INP5_9GAMM|nr:DUF2069 domain-containing protein [Fontimonas thermophila]SFF43320.1 Uncharacterized membrane protein [Fontimonas thermophila]
MAECGFYRQRPLSRYARALAVTAHTLLLLALMARGSSLSWLGALLLAVSLPGILRGRIYTYQWSSMLIACYCALWLAEGWADPARRVVAFAIAGLAAADFIGQVLYVRWRNREETGRAAASGAASR